MTTDELLVKDYEESPDAWFGRDEMCRRLRKRLGVKSHQRYMEYWIK